jgi:hypothetical protein
MKGEFGVDLLGDTRVAARGDMKFHAACVMAALVDARAVLYVGRDCFYPAAEGQGRELLIHSCAWRSSKGGTQLESWGRHLCRVLDRHTADGTQWDQARLAEDVRRVLDCGGRPDTVVRRALGEHFGWWRVAVPEFGPRLGQWWGLCLPAE